MSGWYVQLRNAKTNQQAAKAYGRMTDMLNFVRGFRLPPYSEPAMQRFESLRKLKLGVGANDLRIAASALECAGTVITRNARDFGRVPGLTIADWSK